MNPQYSMVIQWSDEDNCYVVFLPDFADRVEQPCTDGQTYQEAAKHGQEVIETYLKMWKQEGDRTLHSANLPQF
ncbi:MAG: type II toxin-antitoxin system HicB family antitoxin [Elainellaceae cyanobacterium]